MEWGVAEATWPLAWRETKSNVAVEQSVEVRYEPPVSNLWCKQCVSSQ